PRIAVRRHRGDPQTLRRLLRLPRRAQPRPRLRRTTRTRRHLPAPVRDGRTPGRAGSVMHAYNDNDGLPAAADHGLLTELLRDQWGFEGTVVADYFGITFLHSLHGVAPSVADAGAL